MRKQKKSLDDLKSELQEIQKSKMNTLLGGTKKNDNKKPHDRFFIPFLPQ